VTERLELMVAVRPTFHPPAIFAKRAATLDHIAGGRLSLNVVSSWWADEARRYGVQFDTHDDRYARTEEWLRVVDGVWREPRFTHHGSRYQVTDTILEPKPARRPTVYAGGESEAAKALIARACDAYVMHGDPPEAVAPKVADMRRRREAASEAAAGGGAPLAPMQFGIAAYVVVRESEAAAHREVERITTVTPDTPAYHSYQDWVHNTRLETTLSLQDYSVSNRGLRAGLVGTPEQVAERVRGFRDAGVDLLLLQCSPQLEEMERFAETVMPLVDQMLVAS
ncbi:MAG TPA: LLM class flavin-dependent oxidoreductase, partial [Gemmatimonadaceae bacterium]|nr:LLM class flavin-dependent oxidoreductase [Gemmatimonadaceae bacterium]